MSEKNRQLSVLRGRRMWSVAISRMGLKHGALLSATVAMSLIMQGCFTGIESTPRISESDLKREKVVVSGEQLFLADIKAQPLEEWLIGKRFKVTDERINLVLTPPSADSLVGTTLLYAGIDSVDNVTGDKATLIRLTTQEGEVLAHRVEMRPSELKKRAYEIPFTVDMDVVETVGKRLAGNTYYILTRVWCDKEGRQSTGKKFVPVTVEEVLPGSANYPFLVRFVDHQGAEGHVLMSSLSTPRAPRTFDVIFSFTDPHKRYPDISPETWKRIVEGTVVEDMTTEECRLSLGAPKSIDRTPTYGGVSERWTYADGCFLLFHDGRLQQFRL